MNAESEAGKDDGHGEADLSRRRFLAGLTTTTVGFATLAAADAFAAAAGVGELGPTSEGPSRITMRLGKDGLPMRSVAGTYVGTEGPSILVGVDQSVGVVRVLITGETEVCAQGEIVKGDVSLCHPGDRINVGTRFHDNGVRIANWLYTNGFAMVAEVTAVSSGSFVARPEYDVPTSDIKVLLTKYTSVYGRGAGVPAPQPLEVGDYVHLTGLAATPDPQPSTLWGVTIHQMGY